jgi:hypothetical protein
MKHVPHLGTFLIALATRFCAGFTPNAPANAQTIGNLYTSAAPKAAA